MCMQHEAGHLDLNQGKKQLTGFVVSRGIAVTQSVPLKHQAICQG